MHDFYGGIFMKKKLLSLLMCGVLAASMLTGCGGGETGKSGGVEEITWMFWDDLNASEDLITKGYKEVIDRYNETYKDKYHVTAVTTNLEEYYNNLNTKVAANQTPDVFIVSPGPNLTDYVAPGVAMDLTDILKTENADWYSSFNGGVFEKQTYDGKIYAVPLNLAAACVFYNTEMFEKAGVSVPTTYDELLDVCKKLQDAGYTPITMSAGTAWCLSMLAGYLCDREGGPDNLDAVANGTGHWTDQSFIDAGYKLVELSQYFQKTAAGDDNDISTAHFYNEEAAMLIQGSWVIAQINGNNPDFESKCGVFQFPGIEGGS